MPANSAVRKLLKRALFPVVNERTYRLVQCAAKAWDIRTGVWAEPELQLIPFAVKPGESVLDIGANYGVYSYHLSRAVGGAGRVYAFEPIPFTYETCKLVGKFLGFRNVEMIQKGCSDRTGTVAFTLPIQDSGAISAGLAHLSGRNDQRPGKEQYSIYDRTRELVCDVVALDDFLPALSNLSFIKSDIEGADLLAMRGAVRLIERHHPTIQCEINPWFLEGFGIPPHAFSEFFEARGYQMYHYEATEQRRWLRAASIEALGIFSTHNYLFIHPSRCERFASLLEPSLCDVIP
jgi:FkbM family methyltransferase